MKKNVSASNINELRQLCNDIADFIAHNFYKKNFNKILKRFKSGTLSDNGNFNRLIETLASKAPIFLRSMVNSRFGIGGRANEMLYRKFLENEGLNAGKDFVKVTGRGKDLLILSNKTKKPLFVEIKSLKVRERSARTGSDRRGISILAGFFNDFHEFNTEQVNEMGRVYLAVYLPPRTLNHIQKSSKSTKNKSGKNLLRPNIQFAQDMKHFVKIGELP